MLLTDDLEMANKARKWSMQSRENASWYRHTEIGQNYCMSNIIADIVRGQLSHLEEHIVCKKAIYERYKEGFKDLSVMMNPYDSNTLEPNFWLSSMLIDDAAMRKQVRGDTNTVYAIVPGKTCPDEISEAHAHATNLWRLRFFDEQRVRTGCGCRYFSKRSLPAQQYQNDCRGAG